jgi:lipopolysaccharide transport system ATP-binding protein
MSNYAVEVKNIGKSYQIGALVNQNPTLRDAIVNFASLPKRLMKKQIGPKNETLWALRDVSFNVERGQVIGIIGRNGAGKSTLLKILSRITEPSEGIVKIKGRVGSLLEVGTGFNPELTGRDNVFLNGAILGMKKSEIKSKFDEIVDFSGVEKFIDTPVKRYSSGMNLRLAFSVAAHLEPEILVVDEVLAVGDAEFQRKCIGKMSEVSKEGRTIIFVSHDMSAILRLTEEAIVLDQGKMIYQAPSKQAVEHYMSSRFSKSGEKIWDIQEDTGISPFTAISMKIKVLDGKITDTVRSTEPITVEVEYQLDEPIQGLRVGIYLQSGLGEYLFASFDTDMKGNYDKYATRPAGKYVSTCQIPANLLNDGRYILGVNASTYRVQSYFQDEHALVFHVDGAGAPGKQWGENRIGLIRPDLGWIIQDQNK